MTGPVLLVHHSSQEEVWLTARRQGIGASEIAAVLGISPYDSPFSLYWRKANGWELDETDEMRAGTLVEPAVADWWASTQDPLENLVVERAGLFQSGERPWQLATPDRLIHLACPDCSDDPFGTCNACTWGGRQSPPLAVLECKWTATWHGWGDPGGDDIPVHYRAQCLWQCDVMGVDEWHLAVLGPAGFRAYHGYRDEKDLRVMRTAGAAWWARLQAGDPPDVDGHTGTLAVLRRLHPLLGDGDVQVPVALAETYRRARALRKRADELVDRCEARLRQALGSEYSRAVVGKKLVASRSVFERRTDDVHELLAMDDDWPVVDRLNPGRAESYA